MLLLKEARVYVYPENEIQTMFLHALKSTIISCKLELGIFYFTRSIAEKY